MSAREFLHQKTKIHGKKFWLSVAAIGCLWIATLGYLGHRIAIYLKLQHRAGTSVSLFDAIKHSVGLPAPEQPNNEADADRRRAENSSNTPSSGTTNGGSSGSSKSSGSGSSSPSPGSPNPSPTITQTPTPVPAKCPALSTSSSYHVPFAASMPWNVPVCGINKYGQSDNYRSRLWNWGIYNDGSAPLQANRGKYMTQFGLAGDSNDYSTPIYKASNATTTIRIQICVHDNCYASNLDDANCWDVTNTTCTQPNTAIPWNPSWKPSGGNDHEMIIIDESTGRDYELWLVDQSNSIFGNCGLLATNGRLCVGIGKVLRDKNGAIADYRSFNGYMSNRGMGIQNLAMIVTPEDVQSGDIRHALTMEAFNTMFGPACSDAQKTTSAAGTSCGFYVEPAQVFEWSNARKISDRCPGILSELPSVDSTYTMSKLIPEGMRFALDISDTDISNWITSRGYSGAKANTARIFARALRDYGWIVGDTTCYGAGFTIAGAANSDAKSKWSSLGITDASSQNLLDGLFTESRIYVVQPPTNSVYDRVLADISPSPSTTAPKTAKTAPAVVKPNLHTVDLGSGITLGAWLVWTMALTVITHRLLRMN